MTTADGLFGPVELPPPVDVLDAHGRQRRRVERLRGRQAQQIISGVHPLNGLRLLTDPPGLTCGQCAHRLLVGGHARDYPKCELGPVTNGPATDVKASWPACTAYRLADAR